MFCVSYGRRCEIFGGCRVDLRASLLQYNGMGCSGHVHDNNVFRCHTLRFGNPAILQLSLQVARHQPLVRGARDEGNVHGDKERLLHTRSRYTAPVWQRAEHRKGCLYESYDRRSGRILVFTVAGPSCHTGKHALFSDLVLVTMAYQGTRCTFRQGEKQLTTTQHIITDVCVIENTNSIIWLSPLTLLCRGWNLCRAPMIREKKELGKLT